MDQLKFRGRSITRLAGKALSNRVILAPFGPINVCGIEGFGQFVDGKSQINFHVNYVNPRATLFTNTAFFFLGWLSNLWNLFATFNWQSPFFG